MLPDALGVRLNIGMNVTFSPSKYAPSGVGFGQDAAFLYAVPLNKRFSGAGTLDCRGKIFWDKYWTMRKDYEKRKLRWIVDNDFCAEAARALRYDSDFIWESESWPAGEYIVSEKDRNAEKFSFSIAKGK